MFGVGFSEIIVIAVIGLIFVGPKRLPEVAKQAGRLFVQFKRMTSDVRSTFDDFIRQAEEEIRKEERDALMKVLGASPGSKLDPNTILSSVEHAANDLIAPKPTTPNASTPPPTNVIDTEVTTAATTSPPPPHDPYADIK